VDALLVLGAIPFVRGGEGEERFALRLTDGHVDWSKGTAGTEGVRSRRLVRKAQQEERGSGDADWVRKRVVERKRWEEVRKRLTKKTRQEERGSQRDWWRE